MINHQNNFATNPSSNTSAGATTTPLDSIPTIDAPFYLALDATDINGNYEVVKCTSKTATNVLHAASSNAHTTAEEVRMVVPAVEMDDISSAISGGWIDAGETWTYASATTFTIAGVDLTSKYTKGTKIKLTNSTVKYAYVVSSSFSTNTTVTIASEDDLANSTITLPNFSYSDCPQGFKRGEDWYKAVVYLGTTQTMPDGNVNRIELDTKIFDTNDNFNISTYEYTVPISGWYSISAKSSNSNTPGTGRYSLGISGGGADIAGDEFYGVVGSYQSASSSLDYYLEKGDKIYLTFQDDSSNDVSLRNNKEDTFLSIQFAGL